MNSHSSTDQDINYFESIPGISSETILKTHVTENCFDIPGTLCSDTCTETSGKIVSEVKCGDCLQASSTSSANGTINASVFHRNDTFNSDNFAESEFTVKISNTTDKDIDITYNIHIDCLLSVNDSPSCDHGSRVSCKIEMNLNGVNIFSSSVLMAHEWIPNPNPPYDDINNTIPIITGVSMNGSFNSNIYKVTNYSNSFKLGALSPGAIFTLRTYVSAAATASEQLAEKTTGSITLSGKPAVMSPPAPRIIKIN